MAHVAINGLGRIGRAAMKLVLDTSELNLAAVNDLISAENLAYLLTFDSVYGTYEKEVSFNDDSLTVDGKEYRLFHEKDPSDLPWKKMNIDIVFECTGIFRKEKDLNKHIEAGAGRVTLSAPAKDADVVSVVHGVNAPEKSPRILSCASCTTNCITPVTEVMNRRIGIRKAAMTTIHAYTSTQGVVDGPSSKLRRGRAAAGNIVPTSTGAAKATTLSLPELEGHLDGAAVRVPVMCGSIADMVFLTEKPTTVEALSGILTQESESERYRGILGVTEEPLVSSDIIKDPRASIVDLSMTQVIDGDMVKIMSWYDNEWGYAQQMIRAALDE